MLEDPRNWTAVELRAWLIDRGIGIQIVEQVTTVHEIDGKIFLSLTEEDLRLPPVSLKKLGDIKKLANAIKDLMNHNAVQHDQSFNDSALDSTLETASSGSSVDLIRTQKKRYKRRERNYFMTKEELIKHVESPDTTIKSIVKLAISFGYCLLSLWVTAFVMVLVHDRVPDMDKYPPLPDIVLDNLPYIHWAFEMCEMIGCVLAGIFLLIIILHKHRAVILRRFFSLMGTVFLLRCVTMLITSLSVPGNHLECKSQSFGTWEQKMKQAYHIWSHLGMSIQGVRTCGDYMFSGHTTSITMLNHFITEYTPEDWYGLHTTTWVLNLFGVFFILAGHEHYSIDVFIAFYITSRLFLFYHTYAYHHANLSFSDWRMRVWYPLGWLFESGSPGRVLNEFEIPLMEMSIVATTSKSRSVVNRSSSSCDASFGVLSLSSEVNGKTTKLVKKNL